MFDLPHASSGTISIVGNGRVRPEQGPMIDAADCVIRFNNAPAFGRAAGRRVTHLALVNRGGQPAEWAREAGFGERDVVRSAQTILFPFPELADRADELCWTRSLKRKLPRHSFHMLDTALHEEAEAALRVHGAATPTIPSTGLLVTLAALNQAPDRSHGPIRLFGFGFAGWSGHSWSAERDLLRQRERQGDVAIMPS